MPAATTVCLSPSLLFTSLAFCARLLSHSMALLTHSGDYTIFFSSKFFKSKEVSQKHCPGDWLVESLARRCPLTSLLFLVQAWHGTAYYRKTLLGGQLPVFSRQGRQAEQCRPGHLEHTLPGTVFWRALRQWHPGEGKLSSRADRGQWLTYSSCPRQRLLGQDPSIPAIFSDAWAAWVGRSRRWSWASVWAAWTSGYVQGSRDFEGLSRVTDRLVPQ